MTGGPTARFVRLALGCVCISAGGCAPKIKAIEAPGQTVLEKGKAALIERDGIGVVLTPVAVVLEEDVRLAAMRIELLNHSNRTLRLDLKDIVLIGGDGLRRPPMAPSEFRRYAELAQGNPPPAPVYRPVPSVVTVGYGGWHYRRYPYYHRYPYYRRYYGPPHYYYYGDYFYEDSYVYQEYYRRRERIARFVSTLWTRQAVEPGFVAGGHVVFDYELRKKDTISVELTVHRVPTTQPTSRPTTQPLQQTAVGPLDLTFHFGT